MEDATYDIIRDLEFMIRLINIETVNARSRPCLIVLYHV